MTGAKVMKIVGLVLLGVVGAAGVGLLLGYGVMWLWNWLMPGIFGLPEIGYWQAVGLFVLCHLLFKGHSIRSEKDKGGRGGFKESVLCRVQAKDEAPEPDGTEGN